MNMMNEQELNMVTGGEAVSHGSGASGSWAEYGAVSHGSGASGSWGEPMIPTTEAAPEPTPAEPTVETEVIIVVTEKPQHRPHKPHNPWHHGF